MGCEGARASGTPNMRTSAARTKRASACDFQEVIKHDTYKYRVNTLMRAPAGGKS